MNGVRKAQRVYGLALGYEHLNDHDQLRADPLLAVLAEKEDPSGEDRVRERDQGKALAGKGTLNRLELTGEVASEEDRYKKIPTPPRPSSTPAGANFASFRKRTRRKSHNSPRLR